MNIVKKWKLALLATSVMLFPKAGHTMNHEDDSFKPGISTRASTKSQKGKASNASAQPSSSQGVSEANLELDGNEMYNLFGINFEPNEEIKNKLSLLGSKNIEKAQEITTAIAQGLRFLFPSQWEEVVNSLINSTVGQESNPQSNYYLDAALDIKDSVKNIISFALTLDSEEIQTRLKASVQAIGNLGIAFSSPYSRSTYDLEGFHFGSTYDLKKVNTNFNYSLLSDLIKLTPDEVTSWSNVIIANKTAFMSSRDVKIREMNRVEDLNCKTISSLITLDPSEINERATLMGEEILKNGTVSNDYFLQAALQLTNNELESRIQNAKSILDSSPELKGIGSQIAYLALKRTPEDFQSYSQLIKENGELLIPALNQRFLHKKSGAVDLLTLPVKEIKDRISVINEYRNFLDRAAQIKRGSIGAARYLKDTPAKIYKVANKQNFQEYLVNDFLPKLGDFNDFLQKLGDKYREKNNSSLKNEEVEQIYINSLGTTLQGEEMDQETAIRTINEILESLDASYKGLFQPPPPLPKFQSSADIESGPSSSSGNSVDQEKVRQITPSSSSTPAPVVPALELEAREFHMGKSNPYPTTGFSAFEGAHRWTVGKEATISFTDMTPRPSRVSFLDTKGLITPTHSQTLTVKVNGKVENSYVYAPGKNNQTIEIPLPKDGPIEIEFEIPDAASPSALGINADNRVLGISFGEVKFQY